METYEWKEIMYEYKCEIVKIVDGDTIDVNIDININIFIRARAKKKVMPAAGHQHDPPAGRPGGGNSLRYLALGT